MPDILSVLHASLALTKVWTSLSDKPAYPSTKPRWFSTSTVEVADIISLHRCLLELAHQTKSCIIRGRFIGENARHTERQKIYFADQPLHSVMIEIDNHATDNYLDNPVAAINAYIHAHLPECFHEVSYSWSLSSSAGHPTAGGKLKAHVWFWLTTPYTSAQMRAWAKNNAVPLDRAVFDPIQIHFTADPLFENHLEDPVKTRRGLYRGLLGDEVALNLDMASLGAVAREAVKREAFPSEDPLLDWLFNKNLVKDVTTKGYAVIECPFASEHTTGVGDDTSTTYMPAGTEGYARGHFSCLHGHCADRADADFDNAIGYTAEQFEALPDLPKNEKSETGEQDFVWESAFTFSRRPKPEYIIRNVLPKADIAFIIGESRAGKSFLALDLAFAVARGVDWNGKKVKQGTVVYVCAEGSGDFRNRVLAYVKHHGISEEEFAKIPLHILTATPNLLDLKQARKLAASMAPFGDISLHFIDTLAQATPGANENGSEDMGPALSHCREIGRLTNSMSVLVHHTGHTNKDRGRGWSGMLGATDAEIVVSGIEGTREVQITKLKGGKTGQKWGMNLLTIGVDFYDDGEIMDSCAVEYGLAPKRDAKETTVGKNNKLVFSILDEKEGCAPYPEVLDAMIKTLPWDGEGRDRRRDIAARAIKKAIDTEVLTIQNNMLTYPNL